jgi:predicted metal-dependent hydrolase
VRGDAANEQLNLLLHQTEISLRYYLEENVGRHISLLLTENSTTMLSARMRNGVLHVRLHRIFVSSGMDVLGEIVSFLKNKKSRMPAFRRFIRQNRQGLHAKLPKKILIKTSGKFHDLRDLYDEINQEYFEYGITAAITWGSRSTRSSVRKRTLGSYSERSNTIRINPVLDRKNIPRYYIAFVVYHEMLHAALGISHKGERRSVHSREFRRREKIFKDYERARALEG